MSAKLEIEITGGGEPERHEPADAGPGAQPVAAPPSAGGTRPTPQVIREGITDEVHERAKKELEQRSFRERVAAEKRRLDKDLAEEYEEEQLHKRLMRSIFDIQEERRKQRAALAQMTEEERMEHDLNLRVQKQKRDAELKQLAYDKRYAEDPEFRKHEDEKAAQNTARERRRREVQAARDAREAERARRDSLGEQGRADEDVQEAQARKQARHQARMKNDPEYLKAFQKREERLREQERREGLTEQQRAEEDTLREVSRRQARHQARMKNDPEYRQREADRIFRDDERQRNAEQRAREKAESQRFDWAGPFAPTVNRYAKMADAFFGKKQGTAPPGPGAAPKTAPPGATGEAAEAAGAAGAEGIGTMLGKAVPVVGEIMMAIEAVGKAAGVMEHMADLQVQRQEIKMQGGPHQASALMENSAQQQSAMVDWIPVVGPALGKIASFGQEMAAKQIRMVENVAIEAADDMRTASKAAASAITFDTKGLVNQFGELAEKRIPILGTVIHGATDSLLMLDQAVEQTARKMSEYHGGLAEQQALQEVKLIQRDINRAERFGDTAQAANESRFAMQRKLDNISDRFAPFMMKISEMFFDLVKGLAEVLDDALQAILKALDWIVTQLDKITPAGTNGAAMIAQIHDLVRRATEDNAEGAEIGMTEFMAMRQRLQNMVTSAIGAGAQPVGQAMPVPGI